MMNILTEEKSLKEILNSISVDTQGQEKAREVLGEISEEEDNPWFLKVLIGLAAWFAALFFLIFLGISGIIGSQTGALVLGLILIAISSAFLYWKRESLFFHQFSLAFIIAGQLSYTAGVLGDSLITAGLLIIALEVVLLLVYPGVIQRFLAFPIIIGAALMMIYDAKIQTVALPLLVLVVAGGIVRVWIFEAELTNLSEEKNSWNKVISSLQAPAGYGLSLALLGFLTLAIKGGKDFTKIQNWFPTTASLIVIAFYLIYEILSRQEELKKYSLQIYASLALIGLFTLQTPGIMASLLIAGLGYFRGAKILQGMALVFLAYYLSVFYYFLGLTLLVKSLILMGLGAAFLIFSYFLSTPGDQEEDSSVSWASDDSRIALRYGLLVIFTFLAFALVGYSIVKKEVILKKGTVLRLRLAPFDPRALMQGDYMRLQYRMGRKVERAFPTKDFPQRGKIVLRLDEKQIGHFQRIYLNKKDLGPQEILLEYHRRKGEVYLGPRSYFFQEGQASHFERAEYAQFRVGPRGEPVLIGLLNEDLKLISPQ